jgi:5'-deoxynucleotidase
MKAGIEPYVLADESCLEYSFVKAADRLAAYIKCLEELRSGNKEFSKAKKSIEADLHSKNIPEVEYFFDHFIRSFELTLDELEVF